MRTPLPDQLEKSRVVHGDLGTSAADGGNGFFLLRMEGKLGQYKLKIVSSDSSDPVSEGWEHVSVSHKSRTPSWPEMSYVKDLFWEREDLVVQYHPPESQYISNHPYVLHMWHHTSIKIPIPPSIMVGIKSVGELRPGEPALMRYLIDSGVSPEKTAKIIEESRK